MSKIRHLPESELEIMLCVWEGGEAGITAPEISARLEKPLTASALHSYLKRLEEKEYVVRSKDGRTNCYKPLISRESYQEWESRSVLKKLYGNSIARFAAALYDGGALDRHELDELRDYLDELGGGEQA